MEKQASSEKCSYCFWNRILLHRQIGWLQLKIDRMLGAHYSWYVKLHWKKCTINDFSNTWKHLLNIFNLILRRIGIEKAKLISLAVCMQNLEPAVFREKKIQIATTNEQNRECFCRILILGRAIAWICNMFSSKYKNRLLQQQHRFHWILPYSSIKNCWSLLESTTIYWETLSLRVYFFYFTWKYILHLNGKTCPKNHWTKIL